LLPSRGTNLPIILFKKVGEVMVGPNFKSMNQYKYDATSETRRITSSDGSAFLKEGSSKLVRVNKEVVEEGSDKEGGCLAFNKNGWCKSGTRYVCRCYIPFV
jgi:hypothetical protein